MGDPKELVAEALDRKDDRAVFEGLALGALQYHERNSDFQRLLLHSALEEHSLAQMFFDSSGTFIDFWAVHSAAAARRRLYQFETRNSGAWLLSAW